MSRLVIINRDILPMTGEDRLEESAAQTLASLYRGGYRILVLAPQPESWRPSRQAMDGDLDRQQRIFQQLDALGVALDGVYYIPRSLFSQGRKRQRAFADIARRYARTESISLFSADKRELACAQELTWQAFDLKGARSIQAFEQSLSPLLEN